MPSPICGQAENGEACPAEPVAGFHRCLAHLPPDQLDKFFLSLGPGSSLRIRQTVLSGDLFEQLRAAMTLDGKPHFGKADFTGTVFLADTKFDGANFTDFAAFHDTRFPQGVSFSAATFHDSVVFDDAKLGASANLSGTEFRGDASFAAARFQWNAFFDHSSFKQRAVFSGAKFAHNTSFFRAMFRSQAWFANALFPGVANFKGTSFDLIDLGLGHMAGYNFELDEAVFTNPIILEIAAGKLSCTSTRFQAASTLRLRHAEIVLDRAQFNAPSAITVDPEVSYQWAELEKSFPDLRDKSHQPKLASLRGVDVANLAITDLDLTPCRFGGAHHLDKLRLEGDCRFGNPPAGIRFGWSWPPFWRWSRRQVIAEEAVWRAGTAKAVGWSVAKPAKAVGTPVTELAKPLKPRRIADLYRQLRKAQEDSKNEPGAADFYYGEMEMRRNDKTAPLAERIILRLYWATAGYGLRASRALVWLIGLLLLSGLLFGHFGLATGTTSYLDGLIDCAGSAMSLDVVKSENLTRSGQVLRIVLRIGAPLFLGLALLAIRNRVKR